MCAGLSQDPLGQEVARMKQLFLHDRVVRSSACASTEVTASALWISSQAFPTRVFLGVACVALWRLRILITTAVHATRRKKESDCAQGSARIHWGKRLQE